MLVRLLMHLNIQWRNKMTRVIHVTTHMGTGVGKALSSLAIGAQQFDPSIDHEIIVLEKPQKPFYHELCKEHGIKIYTEPDGKLIHDKLVESDIVQIEWWHHPLMFKFLIETLPTFPMRMTMWYHVNGCVHPYLKPEIASVPNKFIGTAQYTLENPYWTEYQRKIVKKNFTVINSSGGFEGFDQPLTPHNGFNVGYFGTLDYAKMYPGFVEYCASISDIPDIKFILIGGGNGVEQLKKDASKYGIEDQFIFTGFVQHVSEELAKLDVVAYLLNPDNYGTTENALLEIMAMGIPVVVFDQCSEKHIIKSETMGGYKITSKPEFVEVINSLYNYPDKKKFVGENAKKYVRSTFTLENMVGQMHNVYKNVMTQPSREMNFKPVLGTTPLEWFISCTAPDGSTLKKEVMQNESKQSIKQFQHYFPEDEQLKTAVKN